MTLFRSDLGSSPALPPQHSIGLATTSYDFPTTSVQFTQNTTSHCASVNATIVNLVKTRLIPPQATDPQRCAKINQKFQWILAQISALNTTIIEGDEEVIPSCHATLTELQQKLQKLQNQLCNFPLKEKEIEQQNKLLSQAHLECERTKILMENLPNYRRQAQNFEDQLENVTAYENPLLAIEEVEKALRKMHELAELESPALSPFVQETQQIAALAIEGWVIDLVNTATTEFDQLAAWANSEPDNAAVSALLTAFKQALPKKALKEFAKQCKSLGLKETSGDLYEAAESIGNLDDQIRKAKSTSLIYGSLEWTELMAARPSPRPGRIERIFHTLNPEHWSKTTKRVVHCLLLGMQLTPTDLYHNITNHEARKALADTLQKDMIEAVPEQDRERILIEANQLHSSLEEHYISGGPESLMRHKPTSSSDQCSLIEPHFNQVVERFPTLSSEEVQQITNIYIMQSCVRSSLKPHPYAHLSFTEWCQLWIKPEKTADKEVRPIAPGRLLTAETEETPATSSAPKLGGILPAIFGMITSLFSFVRSDDPIPIQTHTSLVHKECEEMRQEIYAALNKIQTMQTIQHQIPDHPQFNSALIAARNQLLAQLGQMPSDDCSLIDLAHFKQQIGNICKEVKSLANHIGQFTDQTCLDFIDLLTKILHQKNLIPLEQMRSGEFTIPADAHPRYSLEKFDLTTESGASHAGRTLAQYASEFTSSSERKQSFNHFDVLDLLEKIYKEGISEDPIGVLKSLVQYLSKALEKEEIYDILEELALATSQQDNHGMDLMLLQLLLTLAPEDRALELAEAVAKKILDALHPISIDYRISKRIEENLLALYGILYSKGRAHEDALSAVKKSIYKLYWNNLSNAYLLLLDMIKNGLNAEIAIPIANEVLFYKNDNFLHCHYGLQIYEALFDRNEGFTAAETLASDLLNARNLSLGHLPSELADADPLFINILSESFNEPSREKISIAKNLFDMLFKRGHGFESANEAIRNASHSKFKNTQRAALGIAESQIRLHHISEDAIHALSHFIDHRDGEIRKDCTQIIRSLLRTEQHAIPFETILKILKDKTQEVLTRLKTRIDQLEPIKRESLIYMNLLFDLKTIRSETEKLKTQLEEASPPPN